MNTRARGHYNEPPHGGRFLLTRAHVPHGIQPRGRRDATHGIGRAAMMLAVVLIGVAASCSTVFIGFMYLSTLIKHKREKESKVNRAIFALIDQSDAQADVIESNQSLIGFVAKKAKTTPKQVGKPQKKGESKPGVGDKTTAT